MPGVGLDADLARATHRLAPAALTKATVRSRLVEARFEIALHLADVRVLGVVAVPQLKAGAEMKKGRQKDRERVCEQTVQGEEVS